MKNAAGTSRRRKTGAKHTFVLDTNVLLHSFASMEEFQDNDVVIPMAVVEELDKFKRNNDELGRNARAVIRRLDALREASPEPGSLRRGVPLSLVSVSATGSLYVFTAGEFDTPELSKKIQSVFMNDLPQDKPDNRILRVAFGLFQAGRDVIFISKDINLRLKADSLGLKVMDYETGKVDSETLYTGMHELTLPRETVDALYRDHTLPLPEKVELYPNEFAVVNASDGEKRSALTRCIGGQLTLLDTSRSNVIWNVSPRNKEQRMALDLLLDPAVKLVTLVGGAGTGKTLLALAAGLQMVVKEKRYEKLLVSRPIIPLGNDIGYLPGSKGDKLASWMQPIFDNLEFLLGEEKAAKPKSSSHSSVASLINTNVLELEALTYIRGRSIPRQYVIIDEAQNLTPHEVKTIISRCGEDTKMVLTGDPRQIDNPYLDASSNGLSYAVERLKRESIFGHVTLARSERSELSALASKLL